MLLNTYLQVLYGGKGKVFGSAWKIAGMGFAGLLLGKWYGALAAD
jgi:hypothetical protein